MSARLIIGIALILAAQILPARADERQREFAPELNAFIKLSERARLYLFAAVTKGLEENVTDGEIGANFDYTLIPVLRPELRHADWARNRYLWMRVGYTAAGIHEGLRLQDGFSEKRVNLELTGRMELPREVWLVHRGRVDLREIDGARSERYRYRLGIEREFTVGSTVLVPYGQAEAFYDTRYDSVTRLLYQAGAEIELSKHWRIEPYVARQRDTRSTPGKTDRVGVVLKYFR